MLKTRSSNFTTEFDPSKPRCQQAYALETFTVALVRRGLGQDFTVRCRELGTKNCVALERLVQGFLDGKFEV